MISFEMGIKETRGMKKALKAMKKVENVKSLPILQDTFLLSVKANAVTMARTDLSMTIRVQAPDSSFALLPGGEYLLSLTDMLEVLSSGDVKVRMDAQDNNIIANNYVVSSSHSAKDYPELPEPEHDNVCSYSDDGQLIRDITYAAKVTSTSEFRPALQAIYLDCDTGYVVGTDGHRIHTSINPLSVTGGEKIYIDGKLAKKMQSVFGKRHSIKTEYQCHSDGRFHVLSGGIEMMYVAKDIFGIYPKYKELLSGVTSKVELHLNAIEVEKTVKCLSTYVKIHKDCDTSDRALRFISPTGKSSYLEIGENKIAFAFDSVRNSIYIKPVGINAKYLLDAINGMPGPVTILLGAENEFITVTNGHRKSIIMPMRLPENDD